MISWVKSIIRKRKAWETLQIVEVKRGLASRAQGLKEAKAVDQKGRLYAKAFS
jgi:hypothetical protein